MIVAGVALIAPGLRVDAPETVTASPDGAAAPSPRVAAGFRRQHPPAMALPPTSWSAPDDGHFYAEAQVNGARIRFLIDTGASFVALTRDDAQRAGILIGSERATAIGADGAFEITPVTIDRIAIGPIEAPRRARRSRRRSQVSLLGQSFLSRVGSVEISGDRMVLR